MGKMKKRRIMIYLILGIGIILAIAAMAMRTLTRDRVAPVLSLENEAFVLNEEELEMYENGETEFLLEGVTAIDDRDGDISNRVIIQNINENYEGMYAVVTYHVQDYSGNLASVRRLLYLTSPEILQRTAIYVLSKSLQDPSYDLTSVNWKAEAMEVENGADLEVKEENDTNKKSSKPIIRMVSQVKLTRGETFNVGDYVLELSDDRDSQETLQSNAFMQGAYDTEKPGRYVLSFYTRDTDGNLSDAATMELTVE